jgi:predicted methyltransferase
MARTLTPERQKLKQEAISLRYDYGWAIRQIAGHLDIKKSTIDLWVSSNSGSGLSKNNGHITHLEGDCLELLKAIPDKSIDVLLTDPPWPGCRFA